METNSRIHPSPKSFVRRKRPHPSSSRRHTSTSCALLVSLLPLTRGYTVTWNFGPEDHFFCGMAWDDYNCPIRQNCRSGKSEECLGFHRGETCFKDTPCDSAQGGGRDFSEDLYETAIPTFSPTIVELQPTAYPVTAGPTLIPTDYPIGKPEDFEWPSDDPSDHWYCGIGIDDANERCGIHCPSANECPMGQICYFGTKCDARTHAPSPPPTNRPTKHPTPGPSASPTITASPTIGPTTSFSPSSAPSNPQPTNSPTPAPTQSPTHGPLTAIQSGFFCATDWNDAITNCKMRCPSGEDPECPVGEFCFAYTGCTEERGYPNGRPPMRSEANSTTADQDDDDVSEECVDFKVVITADDWPAETSWIVTQVLDDGSTSDESIAEGTNDPLVSGEAVEYTECLPKQCMSFTIRDTGGDGLCCSHGEGSYEVFYDGKKVKSGDVFYDDEVTVFGRCQETPAPTAGVESDPPNPAPIKNSGNGNSESSSGNSNSGSKSNNIASSGSGGGGSSFRCVQQSLVDRGYVIDAALCPRFVDCYNEFIAMGDDWFCEDGEVCTVSPACGSSDGDETETIVEKQPDGSEQGALESGEATEVETSGESEQEIEFEETEAESTPVGRPLTASQPSKPASVGRPMRPNPSASTITTTDPTPAPVTTTLAPVSSTPAPVASTPSPIASTLEPTVTATSMEPSLTPTTSRPTQGPCDGLPCNQKNYCRSEHGFCGPDGGYCNEKSIWTKECKSKTTPAPSFSATTPAPTNQPVTQSPALTEIFGNNGKPSFTKPSGGGKPGGGKGPNKKPLPMLTPTPSSPAPTETEQYTESPTESEVTLSPTYGSTDSDFMMIGSQEETGASPTPSPMAASEGLSLGTVHFVSLPSDSDVPIQFITNAPTPSPAASGEIQENSTELDMNSKESSLETNNAALDSSANEGVNELECTGEPCDQDTWCRSIYGSCGPGFVYCNAKAIWTSSCRLTHPDVTLSKPKDPVASSQGSDAKSNLAETNAGSIPAPSPSLGLPKLPKPTLPTITDPAEFKNQAAFAAHFATTDSSPYDDQNDDSDNEPALAEPKEEEDQESTKSYSSSTMYDSPEYAKQWSEWAKQVQSSAPKSHYNWSKVFAVTSLTSMLFCA